MALEKESWLGDIKETITRDAQFLNYATPHDEYVNNKFVHVPQAGSLVGVEINRGTVPATIGSRTDSEKVYQIDEFTTNPVLIRNLEEIQVSYDKRNSVTGDAFKALVEKIGDKTCFNWSPSGAGRIVRTSGALVSDAQADGVSTARKAVTKDDIAKLAKAMDKDGMPKGDRYLLMQTDMFYQLYADSDIIRASYNGFTSNVLATGVVAELFGFKILTRPTVSVYDNAATPAVKTFGAAGAATDNLACLAFHKSSVAKAQGGMFLMSDFGDNGGGKPEYFGGLLSALVMFGSAIVRTDQKGVAALVQSA